MDDSKIIALYFERNETAIKETETKFGKLCFSISHNILKNRTDAEECVNDTYLGIWNAIPPERPKNFMAFISKIARNISLKRLEYNLAKKRACAEPIEFSELQEVLADESAFFEDHTEEDLGKLIGDFLKTEKESARNVFLRKYWFFDSIEDISKRYHFSESKVKSMLFQTRNKLRQYLINKGVTV